MRKPLPEACSSISRATNLNYVRVLPATTNVVRENAGPHFVVGQSKKDVKSIQKVTELCVFDVLIFFVFFNAGPHFVVGLLFEKMLIPIWL